MYKLSFWEAVDGVPAPSGDALASARAQEQSLVHHWVDSDRSGSLFNVCDLFITRCLFSCSCDYSHTYTAAPPPPRPSRSGSSSCINMKYQLIHNTTNNNDTIHNIQYI